MSKNEKFTREIVDFQMLSKEWQKEARSNLGDEAENAQYLRPKDDQIPSEHILWDLTECMLSEDPEIDGVISISNNSALAVKLSDDGDQATCWFL